MEYEVSRSSVLWPPFHSQSSNCEASPLPAELILTWQGGPVPLRTLLLLQHPREGLYHQSTIVKGASLAPAPEWVTTTWWALAWPQLEGSMMGNFMCPFGWAEGCPELVKHLWVWLSGSFWKRLSFEMVDWVKITLLNVGGHHPIPWGPD